MADERAREAADAPARTTPADTRTPGERRRDELIEEGVLVSMAALRMKVKNRAIIWMLRDQNAWDVAAMRDIVRDELAGLADELLREADRLAALRPKAARRIGRSQHQYDYGQEDVYLLRQRENTNRSVAERLTALGDDDAAIDALASGVRHDTLGDLVSAAPLPFEPSPDEPLDPEQQKRAIAAIEAELRMMLATAEGRPAPTPAAGFGASVGRATPSRRSTDAAGRPNRAWWKRLRQNR